MGFLNVRWEKDSNPHKPSPEGGTTLAQGVSPGWQYFKNGSRFSGGTMSGKPLNANG